MAWLKPKSTRARKNHAVIWVFLTLVLTASVMLTVFSTRRNIDIDTNFRSFHALYQTYRREGMQKFVNEKSNLKTKVAKTLSNPLTEDEEIFAASVAVYLFPEILPDSNFEKQVALDQWAPLQAAIEQTPHTAESRLWFEEMRANIWNYENPDQATPKLSAFAKEVLKIYNELSSP